jgi:hypothetical protein
MDHDTKKILLLIARALQTSALAQSTSVFGPDAWQRDMVDRAMAAALLAKIENEEKQREAAEKYMDEIYRKGDEAVEKRKEEIRRKADEAEKNNA